MRLVPLRRIAPAMFLLALAVVASPARGDGPLRLNEFMAGPARDWDGNATFSSRDDEWVEVVNATAAPLDLAGWLITDGDRLPRVALTGTLDPGAVRVVYGSESYAWEKANGFPAFGFSLSNSGDHVMLWQVTGPDTTLVEDVAYLSHEAAADRAVGRVPDASGVWSLFDGLNPYTGTLTPAGTGCAPTPGAPNVCTITPAAVTTWGRLKTLYR